MKHLILFFFLAYAVSTAAQNDDKVWVFGTHAGIDFNTTPPSAITTAITGYEGTASICDANGQLLFYTQGVDIWDRNHQVMPNGAGIMPLGGGSFPTSTQQAAIVKMPGSDTKYYVFSVNDGNGREAYYSVVDMSLNGGFGDVVPTQKMILITSNLTEKMAVVAGNNCDAWLMLRAMGPEYRAFHITTSGFDPVPVVSAVGNGANGSYAYGYLVMSPNRTKMAAVTGLSFELYDFNATTGVVSNPVLVPTLVPSPYASSYYGLSFSPDNSKLYTASVANGITQFDITLPTVTSIQNSNVVISNIPAAALRIVPNGKIYIPHLNSDIVSSIDFPNLSGTACQFNSNALQLDSIDIYGLPNYNVSFPHDSVSHLYRRYLCMDSLLLSAFNMGTDYMWENGYNEGARVVGQPGTYVLRYHYLCTYFTDTFLVLPDVVFPALSDVRGSCAGRQDGGITFTQQAGDITTYVYTLNDAAGNVLTTATGATGFQLSDMTDGNYTMHIETLDGCDTDIAIYVPIRPAPQAAFESGDHFCVGEPVVFTSTTAAPYTELKWYFGDNGQATGETQPYVYHQAGTYRVMLVATNGFCKDTAERSIDIHQFDLELHADKDFPDFRESITLQTSSAEAYTISAWLPQVLFPQQQALSQMRTADTTRTYIAIGASATYHCTDTAVITIPVKAELHLPNAFSPNGDGVNDFFAPVIWGSDVEVQHFAVYDRWGNKVWGATGSAALKGWDGRYANGRYGELGTYYWYIEYADVLQKHTMKGDVLLIK